MTEESGLSDADYLAGHEDPTGRDSLWSVRTIGFIALAFFVSLSVVVLYRSGQEGAAGTPSATTGTTVDAPVDLLRPTVDTAQIVRWIDETKAATGLSIGAECGDPGAIKYQEQAVMAAGVVYDIEGRCIVAGWFPTHPGQIEGAGWLPPGVYDDAGNYTPTSGGYRGNTDGLQLPNQEGN